MTILPSHLQTPGVTIRDIFSWQLGQTYIYTPSFHLSSDFGTPSLKKLSIQQTLSISKHFKKFTCLIALMLRHTQF